MEKGPSLYQDTVHSKCQVCTTPFIITIVCDITLVSIRAKFPDHLYSILFVLCGDWVATSQVTIGHPLFKSLPLMSTTDITLLGML